MNIALLKEFEIAELLFFPQSIKKPKQDTTPVGKEDLMKKGSRTSARQREKQARLLAIQREEERAREIAGKFISFVMYNHILPSKPI